jgi:hypothetical protein
MKSTVRTPAQLLEIMASAFLAALVTVSLAAAQDLGTTILRDGSIGPATPLLLWNPAQRRDSHWGFYITPRLGRCAKSQLECPIP